MQIDGILVSTAISTAIYIAYKIINNYRVKSTCNQDNEIIIEIVHPNHRTESPPTPAPSPELPV